MSNVRKRISDLTALTSASLDTVVVGVDNGTTYKIELDVLADAVTSRVNILDRNRLSSLESVTSSFETKGRSVISSSAQITALGFTSSSVNLNSLNDFTSSQTTLNTAFTNGISGRLTTSSFEIFSSSVHSEIIAATNEQSFNGLISGSSQLTSSYDSRYVLSGSITQTTWDNIANKPSGIISSSSQLTSSFDVRYSLSGSVLTSFSQSVDSRLDNLENEIISSIEYVNVNFEGYSLSTPASGSFYKPSNIINYNNIEYDSGSGLFKLNAGKTYILEAYIPHGYQGLQNSLSFNWKDTTNNILIGTGASPRLSGTWDGGLDIAKAIINTTTTTYVGVVATYGSPTSYIVTGQSYIFIQEIGVGVSNQIILSGSTDYTEITNKPTLISGSSQLTSSLDLRYTLSGSVQPLPSNLISSSAQITSFGFVSGSYLTSLSGAISSSSQLTSSFDVRYEGIGRGIVSGSTQLTSSFETIGRGIISSSAQLPNGLISGSSQLTASYDVRYAPSASYLTSLNGAISSSTQITNGSGIISGSSQLTSSFDARYALSGSGGSATIPAGTVSGSSQLTSSYDGRYTLTSSFNSFTASAQTVTTGSNSFNGTQTITGSLIVTTGSFVGSTITANTSSLYLTSGSNMYVQNNGVVEITGSLLFSGSSATFNVPALIVNGRGGDEGGEINLAIPVTNTTLQNRVTTDVWQNRYRIFEGSANAKGVFVDLSKAPAGVGGELMWKASGLVNTGVDVTLGDLKARIPSTGNKSLQLSTTAGVTYSVYGSGIYTQAGSTVGTTINASSPLSVTSTPVYLASGYNFGTAGATDTWVIMDTSNTIAWRITMILGSGFNNNMISIERLV